MIARGQLLTQFTFLFDQLPSGPIQYSGENRDGQVYGITFIDNNKGAAISGSDLGKEYSGQALVKRFNVPIDPDRYPDERGTSERERQERVDQKHEWAQLERSDHSQSNRMQDIAQKFLGLIKAERYCPEPTNPYLKERKRKKKRASLYNMLLSNFAQKGYF